MWEALKGAHYVYVLPAVILYFISVYFRTYRWKYLLSPVGTFTVSRLYPVVMVGYMANNLLPVRLGELVRAYYLGKQEKVSMSATLGTILVERVYDGLTLLFLVAVAITVLVLGGESVVLNNVFNAPWIGVGVFTVTVFVGVVVLLTLLVISPHTAAAVLRLTRLTPRRFRFRTREIVSRFIDGLVSLNSPRKHLRLFVLSLPVWLIEATMYLMVALAFDLPTYFSGAFIVPAILMVTATANLAVSLPSSQGGIGPFEYLASVTLEMLGVVQGVARAYAVALHFIVLAPVTILGLVYLWWHNISLFQLARREQTVSGLDNYENPNVEPRSDHK